MFTTEAHILPRALLKRVAREERQRRGEAKDRRRPRPKPRTNVSVFLTDRVKNLMQVVPRKCPNHVAATVR